MVDKIRLWRRLSVLKFSMKREYVIKRSTFFFIVSSFSLPEFVLGKTQINFACEIFDPCRLGESRCGQVNHVCVPEFTNTTSPDRRAEDVWFVCESGQRLNTSQSANLSGWNISVFAFLNNNLNIKPQNSQQLLYCSLIQNISICQDLKRPNKNLKLRPNTFILKSVFSSKPVTWSLKTPSDQAGFVPDCQQHIRFLFYYQQRNETQTPGNCWSESSVLWLVLLISVVVVAMLNAGYFLIKNRFPFRTLNKMPEVTNIAFKVTRDEVLPEDSLIIDTVNRLSPIFETTELSIDVDQ